MIVNPPSYPAIIERLVERDVRFAVSPSCVYRYADLFAVGVFVGRRRVAHVGFATDYAGALDQCRAIASTAPGTEVRL